MGPVVKKEPEKERLEAKKRGWKMMFVSK